MPWLVFTFDLGDRCWRQHVLVTNLCWWPILLFFWMVLPKFQHMHIADIISDNSGMILSPTCHQHILPIYPSRKPDFVLISCLFENEIEIKVVAVNLTSLNYWILKCEMLNFATEMLNLATCMLTWHRDNNHETKYKHQVLWMLSNKPLKGVGK